MARQRERDLLAGGGAAGVLEAADERRLGRHEGEGGLAGAEDEVLRFFGEIVPSELTMKLRPPSPLRVWPG